MEKIKAIRQQGINLKGDCGPCCLASVSGKTVQEIYDLHGRTDGLTYMDVTNILWKLGMKYENYLPTEKWSSEDPAWFSIGKPSWKSFIEWYDLSIQRRDRGLVGLAMVNSKANANEDCYMDHWVIISGLKYKGPNAVDKIVCVSCPTKGEFEVDAPTFLKKHGGWNTIWVKPIININNVNQSMKIQ